MGGGSQIVSYLDAIRNEYMSPTQAYRDLPNMPTLWTKHSIEAQKLPEIVEFTLNYEHQITGSRCYAKSKDVNYTFLRKISLPLVSYIAIMKLRDGHNRVVYYWKLFADFFAMENRIPLVFTYGKGKQPNTSTSPTATSTGSQTTQVASSNVRPGQQKYRENVLKLCPICPFTAVGDERLLIASHIKPYAACSPSEEYDPYNGYMLTPLYDRLFDRGLMTFTDDRRVHLSQLLTPSDCRKLGLKNNVYLQFLPMEPEHKVYLAYHRKNVFTGII